MTGYCGKCGFKCQAVIVDDSFDHEFGTEKDIYIASDCCEADVFEDEGLVFKILVSDVRAYHDPRF